MDMIDTETIQSRSSISGLTFRNATNYVMERVSYGIFILSWGLRSQFGEVKFNKVTKNGHPTDRSLWRNWWGAGIHDRTSGRRSDLICNFDTPWIPVEDLVENFRYYYLLLTSFGGPVLMIIVILVLLESYISLIITMHDALKSLRDFI